LESQQKLIKHREERKFFPAGTAVNSAPLLESLRACRFVSKLLQQFSAVWKWRSSRHTEKTGVTDSELSVHNDSCVQAEGAWAWARARARARAWACDNRKGNCTSRTELQQQQQQLHYYYYYYYY